MIGQDILSEIDATLDQLIRNAEAIERVEIKELSEAEIEAFQKTQDSLLHHFIHLDERLAEKQKVQIANSKIQEKLLQFEKLKNAYHQDISKVNGKVLLSKRKSKRLLNF